MQTFFAGSSEVLRRVDFRVGATETSSCTLLVDTFEFFDLLLRVPFPPLVTMGTGVSITMSSLYSTSKVVSMSNFRFVELVCGEVGSVLTLGLQAQRITVHQIMIN